MVSQGKTGFFQNRGRILAASGAANRIEQNIFQSHHSLATEYGEANSNVLDFLSDSDIIKTRGEEYAETWIHS